MNKKKMLLDAEEALLLQELEHGEWYSQPLTNEEKVAYQAAAKYTQSLNEKKQTTIRFSVSDLAIIRAKSKALGIGYQNLIQTLVHQYATGEITLKL